MGKAKKHLPFDKEAAQEYCGNGIDNFFQAKKKRGRPKKKTAGGRGRPSNITDNNNNNNNNNNKASQRKSPLEKGSNGDNNNHNNNTESAEEEEEEEEGVIEDDTPRSPKQKKTKTRTNWGAKENRPKMVKAINDWFKKEGDAIDSNGENIELSVYATLVGIPFHTLYKYCHPDPTKRQTLGNGNRGRPKLLDDGRPTTN